MLKVIRQLILAQAGIDLAKERRNLDRIDLRGAYEDLEPTSDQNLERHLEYQNSLLISTLIEENNAKVRECAIELLKNCPFLCICNFI